MRREPRIQTGKGQSSINGVGSFSIREIHIKTTMRYHRMPLKMAII